MIKIQGTSKKRSKSATGEEDSEGSEVEGSDRSDDDRPRKRGRPPTSNRERIKGFTDIEVCFKSFLILICLSSVT